LQPSGRTVDVIVGQLAAHAFVVVAYVVAPQLAAGHSPVQGIETVVSGIFVGQPHGAVTVAMPRHLSAGQVEQIAVLVMVGQLAYAVVKLVDASVR
jgi:hypothetical protein